MKKCTNCGNTTFSPAPGNYAISSWDPGENGPILNVGQFMPVKIENCTKCGKLEIFFDLSQRENVRP